MIKEFITQFTSNNYNTKTQNQINQTKHYFFKKLLFFFLSAVIATTGLSDQVVKCKICH